MSDQTDDGPSILDMAAKSFAHGLKVALIIAAVFIPASYAANRFVYHSTWMRIGLILLAGIGSIGFFLLMLLGKAFGLKRVNYLGFLPLMAATGVGWKDYLLRGFIQIDVDPLRVAESYAGLLVPPGSTAPTVPETVFALGRQMAAARTLVDQEALRQNALESQDVAVRRAVTLAFQQESDRPVAPAVPQRPLQMTQAEREGSAQQNAQYSGISRALQHLSRMRQQEEGGNP